MSDMIERLILDRIGSEFDGECHLTDAEAREAAAEIASLRAQLEDARRADEWQDISTAPKDGTELLLAHSEAVFSGWWHDGGSAGWTDGSTNHYDDYCLLHPTHWRPLPAPPALQSTDGKEVGG